jgi:hypothetical protein
MTKGFRGVESARGLIHKETVDEVEWGGDRVREGRVCGRVGVEVRGHGRGQRGQVWEARYQVRRVDVDKGDFACIRESQERLYRSQEGKRNAERDGPWLHVRIKVSVEHGERAKRG